MKYLLQLAITITAVLFSFTAKSQTGIKGKLVYISCANAIVEIQDEKYFYLGQKEWQKDYADSVLHNVFVVTNNCNFFSKNITLGHTFFFTILTELQANTECVQCSMFERIPMARLNIEVVKK
ncbi:MAG: hypothetical protein H7068_02445 [Pedobacter sp.]|nr:hypothetical protein [Chitinophagaceae bacterium]